METWKEITNSKSYAVSNQGRVKRLERQEWNKHNNCYSTYREHILEQSTNNTKGYCRIRIVYLDGIDKTESVHVLVAEAFIPNPNNLPQVNHKDGIKTHNYVENLEWCSQSENMRHSIDILGNIHGTQGEDCNFAVLKEEQVLQIPTLMLTKTQLDISKLFNVSPTTITEIVSGRSWKHLNLIFPNMTTSQYVGIFYRKDKNKWGYIFRKDGKTIQSCKYKTEEEAYIAMNLKKEEQDIVQSLEKSKSINFNDLLIQE